MHLYMVQYGTMEGKKKPYKWSVKDYEFVWAVDSEQARKYGQTQHKGLLVMAEEVFAALKVPEMDIYTVNVGAKL